MLETRLIIIECMVCSKLFVAEAENGLNFSNVLYSSPDYIGFGRINVSIVNYYRPFDYGDENNVLCQTKGD